MTKPKIPIYPRPVSPLTAEPLRANPGDIYLDNSSESGSDDEQHAAKRRRIEKLAEQYLRGDGLFIMAAGLKGPLTGWVNPWSKKHGPGVTTSPSTSRQLTAEAPEAALVVPRKSKSVVPMKYGDQSTVRQPSTPGGNSKRASNFDEDWPKPVENCNQHPSSTRDDSSAPVCKTDKIQPSNYTTSSEQVHNLKPRPDAASAYTGNPPALSKRPPQGYTNCRTTTLSSDAKPILTAEIYAPRLQSIQLEGPAAMSTRNGLPVKSDTRRSEPVGDGKTRTGEGGRRPFLDLESRRRSIHKLPPSTYPQEFELHHVEDPAEGMDGSQPKQNNSVVCADAMSKPRRFVKVSSAERPITEYQVPGNGQTNSEKQVECAAKQYDVVAPQVPAEPEILQEPVKSASMPAKKMAPPSLSTETSTVTTTNALPSAQVVPMVQPPSVESCSSTSGKMIEAEITITEDRVTAPPLPSAKFAVTVNNQPHGPGETTLAKSTSPDRPWRGEKHNTYDQCPRSCEGIVPYSASEPPQNHPSVSEPDTQEMLARITPLGFSTVRKGPSKSVDKAMPASAAPMAPQKQKKRASFVPPPAADATPSFSAQGSIKGSFTVSKMVDKRRKAGVSPEQSSAPSLFGKLGLDMETSEEDMGAAEAESSLDLSSLLRESPHQQRVPISSGLVPTLTTITSNGSVQQQDAQQDMRKRHGDGQNGGDGQGEFNLASAMDDLGSFLETWDADKEARDCDNLTSSSCIKSALKSKASSSSVR